MIRRRAAAVVGAAALAACGGEARYVPPQATVPVTRLTTTTPAVATSTPMSGVLVADCYLADRNGQPHVGARGTVRNPTVEPQTVFVTVAYIVDGVELGRNVGIAWPYPGQVGGWHAPNLTALAGHPAERVECTVVDVTVLPSLL